MTIEADSEVEVEDAPPSLYEKLVEITDIKYSPESYDSTYEWKSAVCRYFTDHVEDDVFEKLDEDVKDWVNETTKVVIANRGARKKAKLPVVEGLEGDADVKPKRARKEKGEKAEKKPRVKKEKVVKEKLIRGPNRYLRAMRALLDEPEMSTEDLAIHIEVSAIAAGYCMEAYKAAVVAFEEAGYTR